VDGSPNHHHDGDDDLQYRYCYQRDRRKNQTHLAENDDDALETVDY